MPDQPPCVGQQWRSLHGGRRVRILSVVESPKGKLLVRTVDIAGTRRTLLDSALTEDYVLEGSSG